MSTLARDYLAPLNANGEDLFYHTLAILHSPTYRQEHSGALRQNWPRVPLPATGEALRASARLGRAMATLLDPETDVPGVTNGVVRPELAILGMFQRVDGKVPKVPDDLMVTAGWGHAGPGGVAMPGQGSLNSHVYTEAESISIGPASLALLGESAVEVYLNRGAFWGPVPERVWTYTSGGYQVIKKWLSYREAKLLGRALKIDEARAVTGMVRRIAAILLLGPELSANYRAVVGVDDASSQTVAHT